MMIAWDITRRCNLSCIHCYNNRHYSKKSVVSSDCDLSTAEVRNILFMMKSVQVESIQFLGGEPFMRSDFLEILHCANDSGIDCNIATNGILLTDSVIAELAEISPKQIVFSIDGAGPESNDYVRGKGTFDAAITNLRKLTNYFRQHGTQTRIGIQCTLNKMNYREIPSVVHLAQRLELDSVAFDSMKILSTDTSNRTAQMDLALNHDEIFESFETIARTITEENDIDISVLSFGSPKVRDFVNRKYGTELQIGRGCIAASGTLYIRADGYVFPCNYCSDSPICTESGSIQVEALNIRELSLADILDSDYFKSFYGFAHSGETHGRLNLCKKCGHYEICEPCPLDVVRVGEDVCGECLAFDRYVRNAS